MKNFEWDDLRIFLAIFRGRSIRAASRIMGVSHSTVSRRLQAMELQLESKLFTRQPEGFILTEVGESVVKRAERVETEILSIEREIFGRDTSLAGLIRISAPPNIAQHLLIPCIREFAALYPDIDIQLDSSYEFANLSRNDADIALRIQKMPDDHLIGHQLPDLAGAIYATPEYIATHSFTGKESTARWVGWGSHKAMAKWHGETPYSHCKVQHCIHDPLAHLQAVKEGLGFSMLYCFIADKELGLIRLPEQAKPNYSPFWILTHPDLITTERVRVCVRFLREAIYKQQSQLTGGISF
ncbi:LysR family transcriptional regulator [Shewanella canadensis]|uniref:LysR family transcriptional regulator n=1 Tax=Shewanella canadensis TaxID=271096 RepID=A0A431WQ38_9GAMM|nr:LysR family transcriptional regulator [Shewanella canadensis]RTR37752.1 LysR family transcriptional regulator [Shewanella canadensis]